MTIFNTTTRKALLATAGLAMAAGLAGPATTALATTEPTNSMTAASIVQVAENTSDKPTVEQMMPLGEPGDQTPFDPTDEQLDNARKIIEAGKEMNLPPRAWTIAIATSLQESKLDNLGHLGHLGDRNDHDSQGLFQQRPSSGWGSVEQITDPNYSAKAFYKGLVEVDGWDNMPLTKAAQTVQVSAFPNHYAQWETAAADIITTITK